MPGPPAGRQSTPTTLWWLTSWQASFARLRRVVTVLHLVISFPTSKAITDLEEVLAEVFSLFGVIFQGCHVAPDAPVDSGHSFILDQAMFDRFLLGPPSISAEERDLLEAPFTSGELLSDALN